MVRLVRLRHPVDNVCKIQIYGCCNIITFLILSSEFTSNHSSTHLQPFQKTKDQRNEMTKEMYSAI